MDAMGLGAFDGNLRPAARSAGLPRPAIAGSLCLQINRWAYGYPPPSAYAPPPPMVEVALVQSRLWLRYAIAAQRNADDG